MHILLESSTSAARMLRAVAAPGCHAAFPAVAALFVPSLPTLCRYPQLQRLPGRHSSYVRGHNLLRVLETYEVVLKVTYSKLPS